MKNEKSEVHRPRLVLFVGTPTSSYAPVAALWFAALAADSKAKIVLTYADNAFAMLSPEMIVALSENGLDPRRLIARALTPELVAAADLVVTLSNGRQSRMKVPSSARRREHWTISDNAPKPRAVATRDTGKTTLAPRRGDAKRDAMEGARSLRDALRARVAMLVFSEGWGRPEISREDARVTRARSGAGLAAFEPGKASARGAGFVSSMVPELTPAWFPASSLSPPSLR